MGNIFMKGSHHVFTWDKLGDIKGGREDLGEEMPVLVYRLMEYSINNVLFDEFGEEKANELFRKAGHLAGSEYAKNVLPLDSDLDTFLLTLQQNLRELKIGILRMEDMDETNGQFILTVAQDLDCSGLPPTDEVVCNYDEGFIAGIMDTYTGKTYEVTSTLKRVLGEPGDKYTYHSGAKIAPRSFYATVFRERDVLQVWDEADDILKQAETIMMLKPALDTSGKPAMEYITGTYPMNGKSEAEIRDYCAQCDDADSLVFTQNVNKVKDGEMVVPSKFYFDGAMIFISNMRASQIEDAIKSRSIFIDVYLCARDMYNRTKSIMRAKYPNKTDEQLDKFFEALGMAIPDTDEEVTYMTPEIARKRKPLTIRSAVIGMALQDAGVETWARIASMYV